MTLAERIQSVQSILDGLMILYSCNVQPRDEYFAMIGTMHRELRHLLEGLRDEPSLAASRDQLKRLLPVVTRLCRDMHYVPWKLVLWRKAPREVVRSQAMDLLRELDELVSGWRCLDWLYASNPAMSHAEG